jgi:hypothetical protein
VWGGGTCVYHVDDHQWHKNV